MSTLGPLAYVLAGVLAVGLVIRTANEYGEDDQGIALMLLVWPIVIAMIMILAIADGLVALIKMIGGRRPS